MTTIITIIITIIIITMTTTITITIITTTRRTKRKTKTMMMTMTTTTIIITTTNTLLSPSGVITGGRRGEGPDRQAGENGVLHEICQWLGGTRSVRLLPSGERH